MSKFLDLTGLSVLWGKMKAYIAAQGFLTSHQSLANYVTLDGEQTITGKKALTALDAQSTYDIQEGDVLTGAKDICDAIHLPTSSIWHDLLAFCTVRDIAPFTVTQEYTTDDGATWVSEDVQTIWFAHIEYQSSSRYAIYPNSNRSGTRITFKDSSTFLSSSNSAKWLCLGNRTTGTQPNFKVILEESEDGVEWNEYFSKECKRNKEIFSAAPLFIRVPTTSSTTIRCIRITIIGLPGNTRPFNLSYIKLLSSKIAAQGLGSNISYPYAWTADGAIYPVGSGECYLGTANHKWPRVYAATFYGALSGNASTATTATKATQDEDGNVIKTTYMKQSDYSPITNIEMDNVLDTETT